MPKVSANRFVVEFIQAGLALEREREWREGFEAMGRDPDTNDVEYMLPAGREVIYGDWHLPKIWLELIRELQKRLSETR